MNPAPMDADAVLNERSATEGETTGVVSNYQDTPGGTTSHMHFDFQFFTRDARLWVLSRDSGLPEHCILALEVDVWLLLVVEVRRASPARDSGDRDIAALSWRENRGRLDHLSSRNSGADSEHSRPQCSGHE